MVGILAPDASVGFLAAIVVPLILGFIVGVVAKEAFKIGVAIAVLVVVLLAVGILEPSQVIQPLLALFKEGPALVSKTQELAGYLPYSSVTFLIGLVVGLFKG